MSNQALVPSQPKTSLIQKMAAQYGLEADKFMATVQKTIMPSGTSNEHTAAFLVVANQYNLNPFIKEIYAFPSKGGIAPIVSVDGWATIVNRQPNLDGIEFVDNLVEGKLVSITCRIYRKDRARPVEVTEYMEECRRNTEPWNKWPARMLRHKALIQCSRYAFAITGIYDPDEAERIAESNKAEVTKIATVAVTEKLKEKYSPKATPVEVPAEDQSQETEHQDPTLASIEEAQLSTQDDPAQHRTVRRGRDSRRSEEVHGQPLSFDERPSESEPE